MRVILSFLFFVLIINTSHAVEFKGKFIQGSFIIGKTLNNAKVFIDKTPVKVTKEGYFAFGIGRDRKNDVVIKITKNEKVDIIIKKVFKKKYKVQRIDGLPKKQVTPPKEVYARIKKDNIIIGKARSINSNLDYFKNSFAAPLKESIITGVYGSQRILNGKPRRPHYGLDFAAPEGTPIKAMLDGVVTLSEKDLYFTGGTIIFDHGHGISTLYMHMKDVDVKEGQKVKQGDIIGTVGKTGRSTGPHLDVRLNWFNVKLDPMSVLGSVLK
ncbi:MAG: M23 family metallopeptidase [Pelagibacteraceae bacterium]